MMTVQMELEISVEKIAKNSENLTLVRREKKLGLDTAHKFAYNYAIKNNYSYLITMDADLSHEPKGNY